MTDRLEIKRHPDGTRYVQPYLGIDPISKRVVRPYKSFPSDMGDEEVRAAAEEWLAGLAPGSGRYIGRKLADVLSAYIESCRALGAAGNSVETYRKLARYTARLADIDVGRITTAHINSLYKELLEHGGRGGSALAPETVLALHSFLRGAFAWMASNGIVDSSPVLSADKPKRRPKEAPAFDEHELAAASAAIAGHLGDEGREGAAAFAAWLGLNMGMRVGEACAARICDVRLWVPDIHVGGTVIEPAGGPVRQPYTKGRKPRNIAIPDAGVDAVRSRVDLVTDSGWGGKAELVTVDGGPMRPSVVSGLVSEMLRDAGLPEWSTFHSLRHTHATALLMAGEDIKTVSARLGHADAATTLRIYAHAMPGRDAHAANAFEAFKNGRR